MIEDVEIVGTTNGSPPECAGMELFVILDNSKLIGYYS